PRRRGRRPRRAGADRGPAEDPPGGDHAHAPARRRPDAGHRERHRLRHGATVSGARSRGYSMLAALLVVAALVAIAAAAIQLGGSARQASSGERDHQQALALAELGLERTRAYLAQIAATDVDYDRALDPKLDTTCLSSGFELSQVGNVTDD